jgi:hypothetical protein
MKTLLKISYHIRNLKYFDKKQNFQNQLQNQKIEYFLSKMSEYIG